MTNFDKDKAIKLWMTGRPQNVQYLPEADQVWLYNDLDREQMVIEWLIQSISNDQVTLVKKNGKDTGYKVTYPVNKLQGKRWRPKNEEAMHFLWPCPNCEQDRPVPIGDYLCETCRQA